MPVAPKDHRDAHAAVAGVVDQLGLAVSAAPGLALGAAPGLAPRSRARPRSPLPCPASPVSRLAPRAAARTRPRPPPPPYSPNSSAICPMRSTTGNSRALRRSQLPAAYAVARVRLEQPVVVGDRLGHPARRRDLHRGEVGVLLHHGDVDAHRAGRAVAAVGAPPGKRVARARSTARWRSRARRAWRSRRPRPRPPARGPRSPRARWPRRGASARSAGTARV